MLWTKCFRAKKVVAMTGNYAPPEVTIRSYPDSPICDVVVAVRGQEMVLRCRDYRQAMRWARGFEPIPCEFLHYAAFGGAFHCATLDVRRRGTLESYF
jgi:hypothetical protein